MCCIERVCGIERVCWKAYERVEWSGVERGGVCCVALPGLGEGSVVVVARR